MSNNKFSDAELSGLSEEERNAIAGDDENDPDNAVVEGDDTETDDEIVTADVIEPAAVAGTTEATVAVVATDETAAPVASVETEQEDRQFTPAYRIDGPKDFLVAIDAFKAELKAMNEKFSEGDMSVQELLEKQAVVQDKIADLREHQFAAKLASELNKQGGEQRWKMEQEDFLEVNKQYIDNSILNAALNAAVIDIANRDENANRSGKWILAEAHKAVQTSIGAVVQPVVPAVVEKPAKPVANRKPDLSVVPKTLANLPAADIQATGGDEFAALDKLGGVELEQALAKLTPAQEDRYLRAQG